MDKIEFIAHEEAKNRIAFGRWASASQVGKASPVALITEQSPQNEHEATQHGNALASTGRYPIGTSDCFNVGISGGCGSGCFVFKAGRCESPEGIE